MKTIFRICAGLLLLGLLHPTPSDAQEQAAEQKIPVPKSYRHFDRVSMGLGIGMDYGGIGLNLLAYPQKHIGVFLGGGYNLNGFGYNTGLKIRMFQAARKPDAHFFIMGMYGYNLVVVVKNAVSLSKTFYGPSAGIGLDTRFNRRKDIGYGSFALIVPFRSTEARNYMEDLRSVGATGKDPLPFAISVGYRITIN